MHNRRTHVVCSCLWAALTAVLHDVLVWLISTHACSSCVDHLGTCQLRGLAASWTSLISRQCVHDVTGRHIVCWIALILSLGRVTARSPHQMPNGESIWSKDICKVLCGHVP